MTSRAAPTRDRVSHPRDPPADCCACCHIPYSLHSTRGSHADTRRRPGSAEEPHGEHEGTTPPPSQGCQQTPIPSRSRAVSMCAYDGSACFWPSDCISARRVRLIARQRSGALHHSTAGQPFIHSFIDSFTEREFPPVLPHPSPAHLLRRSTICPTSARPNLVSTTPTPTQPRTEGVSVSSANRASNPLTLPPALAGPPAAARRGNISWQAGQLGS